MSVFEGQQVAIGELPEALAILWRHVEESDQTRPLARTLTMNFVGVTDAAGEERLRAAVDRLLVRHPCRAFLVVLDDRASALSATLSARTLDARNNRQTVLEQIVLRAPERDLPKLPGVFLPLLVNDIPTHLYWALPLPADTAQLTSLAHVADQTVVNSALFADLERDCARLAGTDLHTVDLVQFRLHPWRRALAEAFERFDWRAEVPTRARIEHAASAAAAARRLAAWLGERLQATTEIATVTEVCDAPPCDPCRLQVEHGEVRVVVQRTRDRSRLSVAVTRADVCLLPFEVPASRGQDGDLLAAAFD